MLVSMKTCVGCLLMDVAFVGWSCILHLQGLDSSLFCLLINIFFVSCCFFLRITEREGIDNAAQLSFRFNPPRCWNAPLYRSRTYFPRPYVPCISLFLFVFFGWMTLGSFFASLFCSSRCLHAMFFVQLGAPLCDQTRSRDGAVSPLA